MNSSKHKSKITLFYFALVFIIPIVIAWVVYHNAGHWGIKLKHHGVLIRPPVQAEIIPLDFNALGHQWMLAAITPETCEEACTKSLFTIYQTYLALARKDKHLQPIVISLPNHTEILQALITKEYPKTILLTVESATLNKLAQTLPNHHLMQQGGIYTIDPKHYFILEYPALMDVNFVYKDMKRLIKG